MAAALKTSFLGAALKVSSPAAPAKRTSVQVQALFKSKPAAKSAVKKQVAKATKVIKKAAPKPAAPKKEVKKAVAAVKKEVKKAPAPPPAPKAVKKAAPVVKKVATSIAKKATGKKPTTNLSQWYGPSRALFLPGGLLDPEDVPSYLNGSLAGDYGYDPLGLGQDTEQVEKYRANELLHARWAMLAAAGIIIPEGLQANGANIKGGTWFETGAEMLNGGTLNYFAVPWAVINNPLPLALVTIIEVALLGAVERYRSSGEGPAGYSPGVGKFDSSIFNGLDSLYPGGPFDPFKFAANPDTLAELKVKEIKNGRLAMISVLGFAVQSYVTGEGPYANWSKHVADPFGYNLLSVVGNSDRLPTL